jgi:NadR type nicotinamide-nucleotide adenylyltransferase
VLFGPESTGKTSLAAWLAAEFGEPWAPEFVRGFWEERAGRIAAADLDDIARGQVAAEEAAARAAKRIVFLDTDLLTNVLWADLLFPGACPEWVRAEAGRRSRGHALYLFCETDLPFADDPQRCFPDQAGRARCRALWWETLSARDLPVQRIQGLETERRRAAREAVLGLLGGRPSGAASRPAPR